MEEHRPGDDTTIPAVGAGAKVPDSRDDQVVAGDRGANAGDGRADDTGTAAARARREGTGEGTSDLDPSQMTEADLRALGPTALAKMVKVLTNKLTHFPTIAQFCARDWVVSNETVSSSHTETGHAPAAKHLMGMPTVKLPEWFWEGNLSRTVQSNCIVDGEVDVAQRMNALVHDVIAILGLENMLELMLDVQIMDTAPDAVVRARDNKLVLGSAEWKKNEKSKKELRKIFDSDTQVAGEVFEQIALVGINHGIKVPTVGLLATGTSFQLVSTEDLSGKTVDYEQLVDRLKQLRTAEDVPKSTPNKPKTIEPPTAAPPTAEPSTETEGTPPTSKKQRVTRTPRSPRKKGEPKKGRVFRRVEERGAKKREYFATVPITTGDEDTNRKIFELVATYVLCCLETLMTYLSMDGIDYTAPQTLLTRALNFNAKSFSFPEIELAEGINFSCAVPHEKEPKTAYAITQLGYGASGACCFASTEYAEPCVVKIFRTAVTAEVDKERKVESAEEAFVWRDVYSDYGFGFVKAYEFPGRAIILMPYLLVPRNFEERVKLVAGKKESLLYKALLYFSEKGYVHSELRWHHVGTIDLSAAGHGKVAVLCDLAHAEPTSTAVPETKIVEMFNEMVDRMGDAETGNQEQYKL